MRSDNYRGAAPLTPSVIRDSGGADHIKGTRAGENAYTVNGADVTDPVTGNLAFAIPLEAAGSVRVEDNPYSAEFGKATGGASNLETKTGGDKFKFGAARVFPTFHNIIGGKIDSFRPRVTFEGPLIRKRLNFLQSFEYRFSRIYVPSLPEPNDNSTSEAFNSFTQLDLTVNANNRLKLVGALFPEKKRYVGLNTFNPQETTANTKQRGTLFSVSEQAIFQDKSFLSSLLAYKTFAFDVFGQGLRPLVLIPDENRGSYFADTRRSAKRWQWQEQYFARTFQLSGRHSFKLGGELDYTNLTGQFYFRPIEIRRPDLSLSQRIDFISPTDIDRSLIELGGFIQDRWEINPTLTLDGGVRFDRNSISHKNEFSPRVSMLYRPFTNDRTIIRAGIGLFYARSALSTRYFEPENPNRDDDPVGNGGLGLSSQTNFPTRVVTTYDRDGQTILDGPREFLNVIRNPFRDARALRLSLQIDQRIGKHLTLRTGYVHRFTKNEPIITPELSDDGGGFLVLKSRGVSRYNEFQALALYDDRRFHPDDVHHARAGRHRRDRHAGGGRRPPRPAALPARRRRGAGARQRRAPHEPGPPAIAGQRLTRPYGRCASVKVSCVSIPVRRSSSLMRLEQSETIMRAPCARMRSSERANQAMVVDWAKPTRPRSMLTSSTASTVSSAPSIAS